MKDLMIQLYSMNVQYHFSETLKALRVTNSVAKKENYNGAYYILYINFYNKKVKIRSFPKEKEKEATAFYSRLEKSELTKNNAVVLVSVPKMQELQEAYPSYFLDTSKFLDAIDTMMANCKKFKWVKW